MAETAILRPLRNRRVQFQISDVYFPLPEEVLKQLHGSDVLQGHVLDVSSASGSGEETFVVVEVDGVEQPVVVPLKCVRESD